MEADIIGLCNGHEETTAFVAKGHGVDPETIRTYAREQEGHDEEDMGEILPARDAWAVWEPYTGESGVFDDDALIFREVDEGTEGAEPFTVMDVDY